MASLERPAHYGIIVEIINMSSDYRRPWTPEEDFAIQSLVEEIGLKKWSVVAEKLAERFNIRHRSGKQCRERWHNHLDPSIDKKPWTQEEDDLIFELHKLHKKSWSKIAESIPGRTDNSVKNRFYSTLRRNLRKYNKSRPHSQRIIGSVRTILRNPEIPEILLQEHAPPRLKKHLESATEERGEETMGETLAHTLTEEKIAEGNGKRLEESVRNAAEAKNSIEVPAPVPVQKKYEGGVGFERFTNPIEDANLLFGLSQPELNYFYFYPQALANYKNLANCPQFIHPMFPPVSNQMIIPAVYQNTQNTKK